MSDYLFSIEGILNEGPGDTTFFGHLSATTDIIDRAGMLNCKTCTTSTVYRYS
jgi:hypothetical protein